MKRIILFGGSGFVGQSIIQAALAAQYQVISVSRHGKPQTGQAWLDQVQWFAADAFSPTEWRQQLKAGDIVIDAIGILLEKKAAGVTYEKFHFQIADLLSKEAKKAGVAQFVYISAAHGIPFHPGYMEQKLRAEKAVVQNFPGALIIKPDMMFGERRAGTIFLGKSILFMKKIPLISLLLKNLTPQPVEQVAKSVIAKLSV